MHETRVFFPGHRSENECFHSYRRSAPRWKYANVLPATLEKRVFAASNTRQALKSLVQASFSSLEKRAVPEKRVEAALHAGNTIAGSSDRIELRRFFLFLRNAATLQRRICRPKRVNARASTLDKRARFRTAPVFCSRAHARNTRFNAETMRVHARKTSLAMLL